jgi:glycosyltransferase involved in cell wall biosynthesis
MAPPEAAPGVVIIPALDEEATIGQVVAAVPREEVRAVVVADNGSRDCTAAEASAAGAVVVSEPRRGYGRACLRALSWCADLEPPPRAVVFLDGDGSDDPREIGRLLRPILEDRGDLVIGSRARGGRERGALLPQARLGNQIAGAWIRAVTGVRFTDLGPFRAVSWEALGRLGMAEPDYGWTVEMQLKAARAELRCLEIPVSRLRRRGGSSKVTGTVRGTLGAGVRILWCLARYSLWRPS